MVAQRLLHPDHIGIEARDRPDGALKIVVVLLVRPFVDVEGGDAESSAV
jgi:hypothetical protein